MNKKLMSLAVVVVVSGCHAPPEGAVCPAPEEEVAEPEATSGDEVPADQQKIPEEELQRARRYLRETRRPSRGW